MEPLYEYIPLVGYKYQRVEKQLVRQNCAPPVDPQAKPCSECGHPLNHLYRKESKVEEKYA